MSDLSPFPEYEATYQISWHGIKSGRSLHKLSRLKNGSYYFEVKTTPYMPFIPVRQFESANFIWKSGKIIPINYYYNIQEARRHKRGNIYFNWKKQTITNTLSPENWTISLSTDIQDKLTHMLMLRKDLQETAPKLSYRIIENNEVKKYTFSILGTEKIKTKIGELETIKLSHTSKKGYRTTLWLAKNLDYLPILLKQFRQEKLFAEGKISSYTPH